MHFKNRENIVNVSKGYLDLINLDVFVCLLHVFGCHLHCIHLQTENVRGEFMASVNCSRFVSANLWYVKVLTVVLVSLRVWMV